MDEEDEKLTIVAAAETLAPEGFLGLVGARFYIRLWNEDGF